MPVEKILLINLQPEEQQAILELLPQFDIEIQPLFVADIEAAEACLNDESVRLVVFRVDEGQRRPDQDMRRLKRSFPRPLPLFLLIPQTLGRNVKDYIHAGADDFWVLPMDAVAFPNRLHVLLELGQTLLRKETPSSHQGLSQTPSLGSLARRGWVLLRRFFSLSDSSRGAATGVDFSNLIGGKWERLRRLGFGSFGEVWLIRAAHDDTHDNKKTSLAVAKIPHEKKMNTKFLREAAILRQLTGHANAVQLKEIVKEEGRVVLIQEYVTGHGLHEHFERGMDSVMKERAFLQLLEVVAYAHEKKIMHRDIKPENIIISDSGLLKLLDFGTAKDLTRRSISNTVIGSRPYMAPEQIMGKSRLASDVWALGVILYALATDSLPFFDENEKQLMDMILETEPEPPRNLEPDLPEQLETIIMTCLQKEVTRRYRDALELRKDLREAFPDFGTGGTLPG
jgi:hypothetical protein